MKTKAVKAMSKVLLPGIFLLMLMTTKSTAQPTVQASGISASAVPISNAMRMDWTNGNGANRIVLIKTGSSSFAPTNSITYAGNTDFNSGVDLDGGSGVAKCVYNGSLSTITVTNLIADVGYEVQVYEYNGTSGSEVYNPNGSNTKNPIVFRYLTATTGSYTVPSGITSITVEAWGGGGGGSGGGSGGAGVGAGGGGSAYSRGSVVVTPGNSYPYQVGLGGVGGPQNGSGGSPGSSGGQTFFNNASTIMAEGGNTGNPGVGGSAISSVGTLKFGGGSGGLGATTPPKGGGGGGSSASFAGAGSTGLNATVGTGALGGIAPLGGGDGGRGGDSGLVNAFPGSFPGGGGGGGGSNGGGSGGTGGNGLLIISYELIAPTMSFFALNRTLYETSYVITAPASNSPGSFSYTSSNIAVATVSGTTVTIVGPGTTTITATQASSGAYATGVISATFSVTAVETVTRFGGRTFNVQTYPDKNGKLGGQKGVNRNGKEETTKN